MNITSIFERPVVTYSLPQGGIGLMNPAVMTRSIITPPLRTCLATRGS